MVDKDEKDKLLLVWNAFKNIQGLARVTTSNSEDPVLIAGDEAIAILYEMISGDD